MPSPARASAEAGRVRLDELLVERSLARSRAEAAGLILAGRVRVNGGTADKAGRPVRRDAAVLVTSLSPFVSRGGEKLAAALDAFAVTARDRVCLDVGASTGGFTDCLLTRGARRVYAVDVGHGQLDPRLRSDPRVVAREGVNARHLDPERLGERVELATVDVAFISLDKVLPAIRACLTAPGEVVALVKPQFEVGRGQVGKGGVVRDVGLHRAVILRVARVAVALGFDPRDVTASPLRGPKGNREFFVHLAYRGPAGMPDAAGEVGLAEGFEARVTDAAGPASP